MRKFSIIENQIKKLINFCDLDWDDNCINFQNNKNPVKTASSLQVRKPLYNSSKYCENYANYLSNMFKLLELNILVQPFLF